MEPYDPNELGVVELAGKDEDDAPPAVSSSRTWWFVGAAAVVVVAGLVIGIVVFNSSAPSRTRGAASAREAATTFLRALNAGDERAAASVACDPFVDEAKSAARSGADPGISYTLRSLQARGADTASATYLETLNVGGKKQRTPRVVTIAREKGRWLMCGAA